MPLLRISLLIAFVWAIVVLITSALSIPVGHLLFSGPAQLILALFLIGVVLVSFLRAAISTSRDIATGAYDRSRAGGER